MRTATLDYEHHACYCGGRMAAESDRKGGREQTNGSLRAERKKTDDELIRAGSALEGRADAVLTRARDRADRVLEAARVRANGRADAPTSSEDRAALAEDRKLEDDLTAHERSQADQVLEDERAVYRRALAGLLAAERATTDRAILAERAFSDEALRAREDVLAKVSHDLRTLLGGVTLATALLIKEAGEDDAGRRTVRRAESIQRHTLQMNRLVSDLVDLAAIEARKFAVNPEAHNPGDAASDSVEAFRDAAAAKHVSLRLEIANDLPVANLDPDRILQVLANLLSNALKFTPENGGVLVRVEARDSEVQFSVSDTGAGIPNDKLPMVFGRFWQADKADRRGLGLGLFISKAIVDAHGGRIWVESRAGSGCTFYFALPLAKA